MDLRAMASRRGHQVRACPECDLVVEMPALRRGENARCPRCRQLLQQRQPAPLQTAAAFCIAALIMLAAALPFPFVSFETQGASHEMVVLDTAFGLAEAQDTFLAILVGMAIFVLPGLYLLVVAYLHLGLLASLRLPGARAQMRMLRAIEPWMMADVFLVGVLISLIKMTDIALVHVGPSFWAFCAFVLLLAKTVSAVNFDALWLSAGGTPPRPPAGARCGETASAQGLVPCHCCGQLQVRTADARPRCIRCDARLPAAQSSLQPTWALLITAAMLYIPANIYPIMQTVSVGEVQASTIVGGVLIMWENGSWPIALIIFIASILIPILKMLSLATLCLVAGSARPEYRGLQHSLYRITEYIGRWSMVDVFVVALLVALVQGGLIMSAFPGPAALAFCAVVVLTMLAARAFDAKLIWRTETPAHTGRHTEITA